MDKGNFVCVGGGDRAGGFLEMQCPRLPAGGAGPGHKEPICSAKPPNQAGDAEPIIAAHRQGAAVLSTPPHSQRFLIPFPTFPLCLRWETPEPLALPTGTSGGFFRVVWETWPDR